MENKITISSQILADYLEDNLDEDEKRKVENKILNNPEIFEDVKDYYKIKSIFEKCDLDVTPEYLLSKAIKTKGKLKEFVVKIMQDGVDLISNTLFPKQQLQTVLNYRNDDNQKKTVIKIDLNDFNFFIEKAVSGKKVVNVPSLKTSISPISKTIEPSYPLDKTKLKIIPRNKNPKTTKRIKNFFLNNTLTKSIKLNSSAIK